MTMTESTGDEAAKRLGQGEIVEWRGQRLKLIEGVIHFETELTRCWEPSAQFAKMSDVWSVAEGWMVEEYPKPMLMLGKLVEPKREHSSWSWTREVGDVYEMTVSLWDNGEKSAELYPMAKFDQECLGSGIEPVESRGGFEGDGDQLEWLRERVYERLSDAAEAIGYRLTEQSPDERNDD